MNKLIVPAALVVALLALPTQAALSTEHADWGKGPAQGFMTREEAAGWKKLSTDQEAEAFIALFWARRDPTPATPQNEFREEFERRVAAADNQFGTKKLRGSMSDRGRTLVLYGTPKKVERSGTQRRAALPSGVNEESAVDQGSGETERQIWTYEGEDTKALFGIGKATIVFIDRFGNSEFRADRSGTADLGTAQQRAVSRSLTQPNLTAPPTFAAEAPAPAAAPAAPMTLTELPTESLRTAVSEFKAAAKSPYSAATYASWGEFVTAAGETFVPVGLYVPKGAGITAAQNLTFFGVVQDASGANVLAFEQPATLTASKDDFFIDKTLTLGAGKHRAFLGLAENGRPITIAAADLELTGKLDKDAVAISPLFLSNNVYPLMEAQMANDPFAFGGIKVIPKSDKTFRPADELWYFFELRNPGLPEAAAPAAATDTAFVETAGAAAAAAAEAPLPKVQVKVDVEGTIGGVKVRKSAPPMEVSAIPMKGVPGHYGVGNAIPLASFKPGQYTFTIKVIDTVRKTSYTLSDKFTVTE